MKKTLNLILIVTIGIAAIFALVKYIRMDGFAFAWALNFLLMFCVVAFLKSLWLLILNVLLNLYPIFLQRYNRPRIERAINLSNRR